MEPINKRGNSQNYETAPAVLSGETIVGQVANAAKTAFQPTDSEKVYLMNRVQTQPLRELGLLETAALITFLKLNGSQIKVLQLGVSDQELLEIAPLCPNLTCLNLSLNKLVTDAGLVAVVDHFPNLKMINLKHCTQITDEAIAAIATKFPEMGFDVRGCEQITLLGRQAVSEY